MPSSTPGNKRSASDVVTRTGESKRVKIDSSSPAKFLVTGKGEMEGEGYPMGCILWVRGVNIATTKAVLKGLLGDLLEALMETERKELAAAAAVGEEGMEESARGAAGKKGGKGKAKEGGVEFVDYEKGLDTVRSPSVYSY